ALAELGNADLQRRERRRRHDSGNRVDAGVSGRRDPAHDRRARPRSGVPPAGDQPRPGARRPVTRFLLRRLLWGLVLLIVLTFVTYAVFSIIPYDPGRILFPPGAPVTPDQLKAADHSLGVDRPFYDQYASFLGHLFLHGSLGRNFSGGTVARTIVDTAPLTLFLIVGGALLMLAIAIPLGLI